MADDATGQPNPDEKPETGESGEKDWQKEAEKWKALSRQNEEKAKANAEAARRLAEFEESQKTETQKLAERAEAAERRAADLERSVLRSRIAAEKGVPETALVGDDEDALRSHADQLIAWRDAAKPASTPSPLRRTPKSGVTGGDADVHGKEKAVAALRALRGAN